MGKLRHRSFSDLPKVIKLVDARRSGNIIDRRTTDPKPIPFSFHTAQSPGAGLPTTCLNPEMATLPFGNHLGSLGLSGHNRAEAHSNWKPPMLVGLVYSPQTISSVEP